MAQTKEDSSELAPEIRRILSENQRLKREIKGYQGQTAKLEAQLAQSQVKPSPIPLAEVETKAPQGPKPEFVRRWERTCPDCGGDNAEYVKPNVFCNGPECKGVIPLATIDAAKDQQKQVDEIKACWNCGSKGEGLHVVVKS